MFHTYPSSRLSRILPILALILVNLIPLLGVLFRDWDAGNIMFLYWAESIPVGIFALLRIGLAAQPMGPGTSVTSRIPLLLFFPIHFGGFMLGHLVFITVFFGSPGLGRQELALLLSSLFLSHGTSFGMNYIVGREFQVTGPDAEMLRPYGRIFVMHVTLVVGGMVAMFLGEPNLILVILVLLKTGIDLYSHIKNHSRYDTNAQRPIAGGVEQPGNLYV